MGELNQNLKLHELFSADSKTTKQVQQTEPSLEDWKISAEKLTSILSFLPFEITQNFDDELLKRKRKESNKKMIQYKNTIIKKSNKETISIILFID